MAKLCLLVCGLVCARGFADTDLRWERATELLEQQKAAEALSLLEAWLSDAEAKGIRSPEAHHNLAVGYLATENWGPAAHHLATSASLRINPLYLENATRTLTRIQNRVMIQDAVSSHWPFRLALFVSRPILVLLASLGFWIFAFSFFFSGGRSPARGIGLAVLVFALSGLGARSFLPRFAVLEKPAGLFSEPTPDIPKRLVELPAGALLALRPLGEEYVAVTQPFSGWITSASARVLALP